MAEPSAHQHVVGQLQDRLRLVAGRDLRASWNEYADVIERALNKFITVFEAKICAQIDVSNQHVLQFFREQDFTFEFGQILRGRAPDSEELLKIFRDSVGCGQLASKEFELALAAALEEFLVIIKGDPSLWRAVDYAMPDIKADEINAENVVSGTQIIFNRSRDQVDDRVKFRTAYLAHLFADLKRLDLSAVNSPANVNAPTHISLDALYTELYTTAPRDESVGNADESKPETHTSPLASAFHRVVAEDRVVLLGSPGSGKSTFVNFLGLCAAGEQLGNPDVNFTTLLGDGYANDPFSAWEKAQLQDRIPIRIVLRDFVTYLSESKARSAAGQVWKYIANDLAASDLAEYHNGLKNELLERGGLVMFDGLDEVPDVDFRRSQIISAISDFSHEFYRSRIIVTSRPHSYNQRGWTLDDFHVYHLAPFTRSQIASFIGRWYRCIGSSLLSNQEELDVRISRLIYAVENNESLKKLGSSPLLLTLMCSLHAWRNGELPETREELYDDAVNLLLEWWEAPRVSRDTSGKLGLNHPSLTEWLQVDQEQVRKLLSELAFDAHLNQKGLYGTGRISEEELIIGLTQISQNKDVRPQRLIEYLLDRAGLLIAPGVGFYTFPHRTFQEYLAACHLMHDDFPDKIAQLTSNDPDRWFEVALLVAAKTRHEGLAGSWALAEALCYEDPTVENLDGRKAQGALVAAKIVSDCKQQQGTVSKQHRVKYERIQRWNCRIAEGSELLLADRIRAATNLAALGDLRTAIVTLEGIEFCYVPSGLWQPSDEEDNFSFSEHFLASLKLINYPFWISRFPVSEAQASALGPANPLSLSGRLPNAPVNHATWQGATMFAARLEEWWRDRVDLPEGWRLRLPTDGEWEKACRGGMQIPAAPVIFTMDQLVSAYKVPRLSMIPNPDLRRAFPWQSGSNKDRVLCRETSSSINVPLGCVTENRSPYGLQEMVGTVGEWASLAESDRFGGGVWEGTTWALRGGSITDSIGNCTSSNKQVIDNRNNAQGGFRLVFVENVTRVLSDRDMHIYGQFF